MAPPAAVASRKAGAQLFSRPAYATPACSRALGRAALLHFIAEGEIDMAKEKTLEDAFYETLKDVHFAEKQGAKALKKSAKAAQAAELKAAFENHLEESQHQIERLSQIFESIGKSVRAKTCEAMQGITAEMEEDLEDFGGTEAADDVLIGCAQAVEHYEMARYGLLKTWARKLGYTEAEKLLDETLQEEKRSDETLSGIAARLPGPHRQAEAAE